ncbi:MAG TPA: hypothetical protein VNZ26_01275 [Vicinamibacterales bacterium]|jgi:hypothetical protein|nr:hypothetical protein [Vicinamibacterales bacterium]
MIDAVTRLIASAWRVSASFLIAILMTGSAQAQDSLSNVLSFLLTNRSVATGDFARDESAAMATSETLSRALLVDIATLPVSAAGGGFAYTMNPLIGTVERASESFGPVFSERALTTGRHRLSFGATYRYAEFDRLNGKDLQSGTLVTTANQFTDEPQPFDVETLKLNLRAKILTMFASYGVTDRLDVGAALPIVSLSLDGERWDTYRGQTFLQAKASASATGPADVAIRAKYHILGLRETGLSVSSELRLPSGSTANLLGVGKASVKLLVIGSVEKGRLASHVNAGILEGGASGELDYNGAVTYAVTNRLTLVGEAVGRRLNDLGTITELALPNPTIAGVQTIRLVPEAGGLNTATVVAGVKVNVTRTWLVEAHVLTPASDSGLHTRPALMVGLNSSLVR